MHMSNYLRNNFAKNHLRHKTFFQGTSPSQGIWPENYIFETSYEGIIWRIPYQGIIWGTFTWELFEKQVAIDLIVHILPKTYFRHIWLGIFKDTFTRELVETFFTMELFKINNILMLNNFILILTITRSPLESLDIIWRNVGLSN